MTISDTMQGLVLAALLVHAVTILPMNANNTLSFFLIKIPAAFSGLVAAVLLAKVL